MSNKIPKILYVSWGLLGFYRGTQYYDYCYEEEMKLYLKDPKYYTKPQDFYSHKVGAGALGTVAYILPFFCVLPLIKEINRLEINLRGLEEEKQNPKYHIIF